MYGWYIVEQLSKFSALQLNFHLSNSSWFRIICPVQFTNKFDWKNWFYLWKLNSWNWIENRNPEKNLIFSRTKTGNESKYFIYIKPEKTNRKITARSLRIIWCSWNSVDVIKLCSQINETCGTTCTRLLMVQYKIKITWKQLYVRKIHFKILIYNKPFSASSVVIVLF